MSKIKHRIVKELDGRHPLVYSGGSRHGFMPGRIEIDWEVSAKGEGWELGHVTVSSRHPRKGMCGYDQFDHTNMPVWLAEIVEGTRPPTVPDYDSVDVTGIRTTGVGDSRQVYAEISGVGLIHSTKGVEFLPAHTEIEWKFEHGDWRVNKIMVANEPVGQHQSFLSTYNGEWVRDLIQKMHPYACMYSVTKGTMHVTNVCSKDIGDGCKQATADVSGAPPVCTMSGTEFWPAHAKVVYEFKHDCLWAATGEVVMTGGLLGQYRAYLNVYEAVWISELVDKMRPVGRPSASNPVPEAELLTAYNKVLAAKKEHDNALAAWTALVGGGSV